MLTPQQRTAKRKAKRYFLGPRATAATIGGAEDSFVFDKNVIGVGIGPKVVSGAVIEARNAVRVYVRVKVPKNDLSAQEFVPASFGGLPTDVVEVGDVAAWQSVKTWQRFGKHRPASCGISAGHLQVTVGTLGCLVAKNGQHFILSNNHVLANVNAAAVGDSVTQPGRADGGTTPADTIATLAEWKPLDLTGAANDIDAALALIGDAAQTIIEPEIVEIGRPKPTPKPVAMYQSVRKHGRTTGHTVGVVMDVSADLWVAYGAQRAWFEDQIAIMGVGGAPFSQPGDSGSLIVDAVTLEPVALLFAGGRNLTFANPIDTVLTHFGVQLV